MTTEEIEYYKRSGFDVEGNLPIYIENACKRKDCFNELKEDEIYIGNTDTRDINLYISYKNFIPSLRIGEQAYDIHGKPIPRFYCRPLFINKSDEQNYDELRAGKCTTIKVYGGNKNEVSA